MLKREKAPAFPGPLLSETIPILLQSVFDAGERRVQLRTELADDGDDRDRDAGGDQAILDGSRARLVLHKARNQVRHLQLH